MSRFKSTKYNCLRCILHGILYYALFQFLINAPGVHIITSLTILLNINVCVIEMCSQFYTESHQRIVAYPGFHCGGGCIRHGGFGVWNSPKG